MIPVDPISWAVKAFRDERSLLYATYADYAAGRQSTAVSASSAVTPLGNLLLAMTYNRCAPVVDAIADRLTVTGFRDADGKGDATAAMDLWNENRMDKREGEVNQEALTSGDGYVIIWPDTTTGVPTIWPQDAAAMRVFYDDERPGLIQLAAKLWRQSDDYLRLNVYLPDRLEKYISRGKYKSGLPNSASTFEVYQPDGDLTWPLGYDWLRPNESNIPVFHFANNARTGRYGVSELRDVIPLQDALNKAVTDLIKGSELGGHPQKWATGVETKPDETVTVGTDRILGSSRPDARFGNFDASNLDQLIGVVNQFDLMIARVARIPVNYLVPTPANVSGASKAMDADPFTEKIKDRQTAWGNIWEDAMTMANRQRGIEFAFQLEAVYESAQPRSDSERADLAVKYSQAGFPLASVCRLVDMTEEEIAAVLADLDANMERARAAFDSGEPLNPDDTQQVA